MPRRWAIAIVAAAVTLLVVAGALGLVVAREYTECYANFRTQEAAERAADSIRDAGFDADVDRGSVTFSSGETGDDAREFRGRFHAVVRRERGELAHPDGGCLERAFFE